MTMNQSNLFASHTLPPTSQLTSLLVKRKLNTDLADILVKKLKTDSTSETISTEGSPASKNDSNEEGFSPQSQSKSNAGSTVEEDDGSSDLECGETFETMIASTSPSNSGDASQLHQALEFLKTKFLFQRELANSKLLAAPREEEFFIPAFRDPAENAVVDEEEAVEKKDEEMKAEKKKKETEAHSLNFIYGDVEFPFLSISVPYAEFSDFKLPPLSTSFIQSKEVMKPKEKKVKEEKKLVFKVERDDAKKSDSLKNMKLKTQETNKKVLITSQKMIMKQKKLRKEKEEKKKEVVSEQAVQIQKIMTELKTQKNNKEKTKEIKEKVKVEEKETISYFRHAKKNSRRQKNRWQVAQDEMLLRNGLPLPSQAKEMDFMFVGAKKKAGLTQVGDDCQADMAVSEKERTEKRVPKLKWDPSAVNEKELQIYFKEVKTVTRQNYVEEAAIELVVENNHDMKEALQFIKINKAECLKKLKIKPNSEMEIEY